MNPRFQNRNAAVAQCSYVERTNFEKLNGILQLSAKQTFIRLRTFWPEGYQRGSPERRLLKTGNVKKLSFHWMRRFFFSSSSGKSSGPAIQRLLVQIL